MKPILFNTEMVRAILDERKTVTRRPVKPQPPAKCHIARKRYSWAWAWWTDGDMHHFAPPYHPGDILYVRETWCWCPCWDCGMLSEDGTTCQEDGIERVYFAKYDDYGCFCYKASCMDCEVPSADIWHPSIHMPREAVRIFLRVTGVQVERLQDITAIGMIGEGFTAWNAFMMGWDSTIKPKDRGLYGWETNPWVWVIGFERISKEEALEE